MFVRLPTGRNNAPNLINILNIESITQKEGEATYIKMASGEQHAVNNTSPDELTEMLRSKKVPVHDFMDTFGKKADELSSRNASQMNRPPERTMPDNTGPSAARPESEGPQGVQLSESEDQRAGALPDKPSDHNPNDPDAPANKPANKPADKPGAPTVPAGR